MWIFIILLVFSIFSMNFFPFNFQAQTALPFWDRKDTDFFLISKFFRNFFEKIFRFKTSEELSPSPLSFAGCKGRHYSLFCKLFCALFWRFFTPEISTFLISGCYIEKYFLDSHFRICREKDLPLKVICKIARTAERWIRKLL